MANVVSYRLTLHAPTLHIPTTVQGVLAARIDRLAPDEKVLLQHLAVMGREFPLSLVRQVILQSEEELYRMLASLQHREFLYEQPALPEVEYLFKHALTQEVAYNSVLLERRKALHERTAQAIVQLYQENLDEHYSDLAHHYSRSGNTQKAVEYLGLAGQQAVQRSANAEAMTHLTTALELLTTLPDTPERTQQELASADHPRSRFDRHQRLGCAGGGNKPTPGHASCVSRWGRRSQLFPVLWGLWVFHDLRAKFQKSHGTGGAAPQPGPAHVRPRSPSRGPRSTRVHVLLPRTICRSQRALGARRCPL